MKKKKRIKTQKFLRKEAAAAGRGSNKRILPAQDNNKMGRSWQCHRMSAINT